jgi:predicted dehydrogenase
LPTVRRSGPAGSGPGIHGESDISPSSGASGRLVPLKWVNIGIIGCGGIAQGAHMPGYSKLPKAKMVACCDVDAKKAKEAAGKFGIGKVFTDYRELVALDEIDAVSVCTPNFAHRDPTVAALEAGKHVLVEKPMAMNSTEARSMIKAAKKHGRKLMVGLNYRWGTGIQALKRFADAGEFGDIYFAKAQCLRRRGIPGWGVFIEKDKQGGGPLVDLGVHVMDAVLYIMGFPRPVAASGATYTKFGTRKGVIGLMGQWDPKKYTVEDYALGLVRFKGGETMFVETSFAANIERDVFNFGLLGTKAGCTLDPLKVYGERNGNLIDTAPVLPKGENTHEIETRKFVDCILKDTEPPVTGEQGLVIQKIMDAIYASAEAGGEVKIA